MIKSLQFLSGGGEMGALMRAYNWKLSPIGEVDIWPQSLLTSVGILLNSKSPMFLFWGPHHICFYNDAYLPCLGIDGKHPSILGMKGEDAWSEKWLIIKSLVDQVLSGGEATWSEDQLIRNYRNEKIENIYWTFSYSTVKDESGLPAGVLVVCTETTDKVHNHKKVVENDSQLNVDIEATQLGTWDYNPHTKKFIGNHYFKDWFNLTTVEEIDILAGVNHISENDQSRITQAMLRALEFESGGIYDVEYSIINPVTKQERIVRAIGKASFGADKKAYRFNGTLQDITQRSMIKKEIEEIGSQLLSVNTNNLYEKVIVNINDAVLITEAEPFELPGPKILFVNEAFCKMTGYTAEEVIGKTPRILQGSKTDRKQLVKLKAALSKWESIRVELINYRKDGTEFAVEFEIVPVANEMGWFTHWISVHRDVTDRRHSQDNLEISEAFNRTILESSPDCLKVLDIEGRIQYMNPSGICLMDIDDFSTIKNKYWWTLWGSENEALVKASVEKAVAGETAKFTALCPTAKGILKWWDVVVSPVFEPDEPVQKIISVSRDITDKVKSQESIEKLGRQLKLATDSAKVGIWSLDILSSKLEWSSMHKKLWGYDEHCEDLTYEDWLKSIVPADKLSAFQKIEESKINQGIYEVAYQINRVDDNVIRSIRSVGKYYYNDKGEAETLTGISIDITDQKESELKLKVSEEKYRGLFEAIDQGLSIIEIIFDENNIPIDYRFIENNTVFQQQTGLPDVTNKTAREAIPALDHFWFETFGKVALTGKSIRFTQKSEALNRWFDVYAFRLGKQGNYKVAILFTNITDRKKAELGLKASEKLFRVLTHNSPDIITRLDKDGRYLYASPSIKKLTGKNAEEFIGRKYREAGLAEHICQLFDKYIPLVLLEKKLHTIEFSVMNGLEVYSRLVPEFNEMGEAVSVMMIHADITERKQAEEKIKESEAKFRMLSETIPTMVWTATSDAKKNFFNQYFLNYTGLSFEELKNDGMRKIIFPDDLDNDLQLWQHSLKTGEDFKIEKRLRHHDGTYRWHVSHGIAQKDNNGKITGWIGSNTDIHDQKIKEQQKDEFISIASHEMKTPLTSAKGYLELLLPLLSEENQTAFLYANKANQAVERLHSLVVELLDVSKIQNGKLNYNTTTFDFNEMIDEAIENIQFTAKNHNLQKIGNSLCQVKGDKDRLQQVMINLLSNAIKYSPNADKVFIKVEQQHDKIQVSVQDFGIGMSSQHLDKIFNRYYRVQEHAVFFQGLGIGLHISNNIIQRHNGTMWAESECDKGSTFYFTLPL